MIFTSVDDVIEPAMSIDSQVIVRIPRIPEKRFWYSVNRDSSGQRITRIKRKFRLQKRGTGDAGEADKWIVRCHYHTIETDPTAVYLNAALLCIELTGGAFFENVGTVVRNFRNQRSKIFSRMKLGLIGKADRR